jgi:hypothetical protein
MEMKPLIIVNSINVSLRPKMHIDKLTVLVLKMSIVVIVFGMLSNVQVCGLVKIFTIFLLKLLMKWILMEME